MAKVRGLKRRVEPFGATQKRGREFAATRKLKNRIAELELEIGVLQRLEANMHADAVEALRKARDAQPTEDQLNALRRVAHVPLTKLVELNLQAPALVIAEWVIALENARR